MTIAQLEQRVSFLEQKVGQLEAQLTGNACLDRSADGEAAFTGDAEIIPGTEYPVVLSKPPTKEIRLRGVVREMRPARQDLGLSDAEIALFAEAEPEP